MKRNYRRWQDQTRFSRREFLKGAAGSSLVWAGVASSAATASRAARSAETQYPSARATTRGPKSHFFGYYDKCPWDKTGRYLLATEIGFCDRQPQPGEALTVGMVDLRDDNRFIPLDSTAAWSWQQGTMLQWLGSAPDREIIHNSVEDDRYIAVIRDVHSGKTRRLSRPIYAVSADARQTETRNGASRPVPARA